MVPTLPIFMSLLVVGATFAAVPAPTVGQSKQKQEQRDNKRVREAEQSLSEAKKKLTENQRSLREAARALLADQNKLVDAKQALRKAESEAEKKLGEKIGLPALLDRADSIRDRLELASKPVREALQKEPRWKQAVADATQAKLEREAVFENSELSDADRETSLRSLAKTMSIPAEMEATAIASDAACASIKKELADVSDQIDRLRKQIDAEKVAKDPGVAKVQTSIVERQRSIAEGEKKLATARKAAASASRSMAEAQTKLARAKQADKRNDQ